MRSGACVPLRVIRRSDIAYSPHTTSFPSVSSVYFLPLKPPFYHLSHRAQSAPLNIRHHHSCFGSCIGSKGKKRKEKKVPDHRHIYVGTENNGGKECLGKDSGKRNRRGTSWTSVNTRFVSVRECLFFPFFLLLSNLAKRRPFCHSPFNRLSFTVTDHVHNAGNHVCEKSVQLFVVPFLFFLRAQTQCRGR